MPDSTDTHKENRREGKPLEHGHAEYYVIEVMGFEDRKYEESKKRSHPRMRRLGQLKEMEGREFGSRDKGIDRQREELTADIALDLLRRWRRAGARPAAA